MAQFGPFATVRSQVFAPQFAAAFEYVAQALHPGSAVHDRILALARGQNERVELGGGLFAMEQVYDTRPRTGGFFESHRRYVDVQVIVEGAELMEVEDIARLHLTVGYDAERDFAQYAIDVPGASRLCLRSGDVALFFPEDGHLPGLQLHGTPALVRKTVVKVPVS